MSDSPTPSPILPGHLTKPILYHCLNLYVRILAAVKGAEGLPIDEQRESVLHAIECEVCATIDATAWRQSYYPRPVPFEHHQPERSGTAITLTLRDGMPHEHRLHDPEQVRNLSHPLPISDARGLLAGWHDRLTSATEEDWAVTLASVACHVQHAQIAMQKKIKGRGQS